MAEECMKKIEQILNNYHIENTTINFNSMTKVLLDGQKIDIYKKIIEMANYCIIIDENNESFTTYILASKNKRLLEDIQQLFAIKFIDSSSYDFTSALFYRIKIYKNVCK